MSHPLVFAAVLLVLVGLVHSILGERYIISRVLRRDNLPKLFGTDLWTKRILRFAWHLTTIAWFGFAILLLVLADYFGEPVPGTAPLTIDPRSVAHSVGLVVAGTFAASAVLAAYGSRFRHPAWVAFAGTAILTWIAL